MEISEERVCQIDHLLKNIDSEISISMSFMRRTYGMSFSELESRMSGINISTIKRYFQQSYPSMRPLHFLAALSWILMVPATAFYYKLSSKESFRGMDEKSIEALIYIGRLPYEQFETVLDLITNAMDSQEKESFTLFRNNLYEEGIEDQFDNLLPPKELDMNLFAIDYYRSVAITMKRFRLKNDISVKNMARVLGMSVHLYDALEDPRKTIPFSVSLGVRTKLGFLKSSHVEFTSEMTFYPQFHQLRRIQHRRDVLLVESMRRLPDNKKKWVTRVLREVSYIY